MRSLIISLQSEFYKSRKTMAFWAAILLPLVICGLITVGFWSNAQKIISLNYSPEALWAAYSGTALGIMGMLILPFYVIFMAFSVNNMEHKNDTWKTLFAQPLNKFSIYAAKYLFAVLLILLTLSLFAVLTIAFGQMLHLLNDGLKFNEFSPVEMLSKIYLKLFLSSLGILSVQFIISLIWVDFLKPMGIGFVGVIMGIIVASKGWKFAYLVPYSHPMLVLMAGKSKTETDFLSKDIYTSLIYALVFFIIGYFIVSRKSVK